MLLTVCKTIAIKHRADVVRRFIRERVMRKQRGHISRSLQQPDDQSNQPWILLGSLQSGKPHLPVESWLVWCAPTRGAFHVTRFPLEFIGAQLMPSALPSITISPRSLVITRK